MTPKIDVELVRRALAGDRRAGERLAERLTCVPRIFSVLNRRFGSALSHHDLEDLAQDTLIAMWRKLPRFEGLSGLEAWAYRFCFGQYMNRFRAKGHLGVATNREELAPSRGAAVGPCQ